MHKPLNHEKIIMECGRKECTTPQKISLKAAFIIIYYGGGGKESVACKEIIARMSLQLAQVI